jgi:hypothetical protein
MSRQIDAGDAQVGIQLSSGLGQDYLSRGLQSQRRIDDDKSFRAAVAHAIQNDIKQANLFFNTYSQNRPESVPKDGLLTATTHPADMKVMVEAAYTSPNPDRFYFTVTFKVADGASPTVLKSYTRTFDLHSASKKAVRRAMPEMLHELKEELVRDLDGVNLKYISGRGIPADSPNFEGLLVAKELAIGAGRDRNRTLIAAQTVSLPHILQADKTSELVALKVKFEQTMYDLEHESEVAKDLAQSEAAAGSDAEQARELSLVYRERLEILKPMLSSINEEIANRGK